MAWSIATERTRGSARATWPPMSVVKQLSNGELGTPYSTAMIDANERGVTIRTGSTFRMERRSLSPVTR